MRLVYFDFITITSTKYKEHSKGCSHLLLTTYYFLHSYVNINLMLNLPQFLEQLLDSPPLMDVIVTLLLFPQRYYSRKELIAKLEITEKQLTAALAYCEKYAMLDFFSNNGTDFYRLNIGVEPLSELKQTLMQGSFKAEDELFTAAKQMHGVKALYVFGVFVARVNCPADILVLGQPHKEDVEKFVKACEKMTGQQLTYAIMDEEEFWLRKGTFDRFIKELFDYDYVTVVDKLGKK